MLVLRNVPVLAPPAGEIATERAEGENLRAWPEVMQRLFLDGIDVNRNSLAVDEQVQRAIHVAAHTALTSGTRGNGAPVLTGGALDITLVQLA